MKRLIIICLLMIAIPAFAITVYERTDYTGGTDGVDLDAIDGATLSVGDKAIITKDVGNYTVTSEHTLMESGATESGIAEIAPDTNAGDKRWHCDRFPYAFGTVAPTNDLGGELIWLVKP